MGVGLQHFSWGTWAAAPGAQADQERCWAAAPGAWAGGANKERRPVDLD